MWDELGIAPCDDPKAIRRAYAARLKKLDPDRDPAAFARLREALEWALAEVADAAEDTVRLPPARAWPPEPDVTQDRTDPLDLPRPQATSDEPPHDRLLTSGEPAVVDDGADATREWLDVAAPDHALLAALESALDRRDAVEAMKLYYRAVATGAVPLSAAPPLLDRLFALAVEGPTVDRAAFRDLARIFGWDKPAHESGAMSDLRRRVLARLAAEDWYDSLLAAAERRAGTTRKQAKLARLMLGRIGRRWMARIDRAVLKTRLDEFRTHEAWLRDRIDPAWTHTLEKRWRRREIATLAFFTVVLAAMLVNGARLIVMDAVAGTLSVGAIVAAPFGAAFLLWLLKQVVTPLYRLARPPPDKADPGPPDDLETRLRWLERQAELAYEAMYDAPAGSALAGRYNDAKEFLHDAIALAHRLGQPATAERLSQRLAEIKAIFRTQFPAE